MKISNAHNHPHKPLPEPLIKALLNKFHRSRHPRWLDAEDLVQEVYCEMLKTHDFTSKIPESHVYTAARNVLIAAIRHATRKKRNENQTDLTPIDDLDEHTSTSSIYALLDPDLLEQHLRSTLETIAPDISHTEAEIIIKTASGFEDHEIETQLALKKGHAKVLRYRAKQKILAQRHNAKDENHDKK